MLSVSLGGASPQDRSFIKTCSSCTPAQAAPSNSRQGSAHRVHEGVVGRGADAGVRAVPNTKSPPQPHSVVGLVQLLHRPPAHNTAKTRLAPMRPQTSISTEPGRRAHLRATAVQLESAHGLAWSTHAQSVRRRCAANMGPYLRRTRAGSRASIGLSEQVQWDWFCYYGGQNAESSQNDYNQ